MDVEEFRLALEWNKEDCPTGNEPAEIQVEWMDRKIKETCDLAAPRSGSGKAKRQTYWWDESMNALRDSCNIKRRRLTRFNRIHGLRTTRLTLPGQQGRQQPQQPHSQGSLQGSPITQQEKEATKRERRELQTAYKEAKKEFRSAINKAKLNAWAELLNQSRLICGVSHTG